jgi:hypothetical protein
MYSESLNEICRSRMKRIKRARTRTTDVLKWVFKNGIWSVFVYYPLFYITKHHLFTLTLCLKLAVVSFYSSYGHLFKYKGASYIKPWMRLTDTSYIASVVYYMYPSSNIYGLVYTVHSIVSVGYWVAWKVYNVKDLDDREYYDNDYSEIFCSTVTALIHGLPFLILQHDMCMYRNSFGYETIKNACSWVATWFCAVYVPWRMYSGDPIYSIMINIRDLNNMTFTIFGLISLIIVTNIYGGYTQEKICN